MKLIDKFNSLNDKGKHFIVGFIVTLPDIPFSFLWYLDNVILCNFLLASFVFISKEIIDKYKTKPTGFDVNDLFADYLGWFVGTLFSTMISLILLFIFKQIL